MIDQHKNSDKFFLIIPYQMPIVFNHGLYLDDQNIYFELFKEDAEQTLLQVQKEFPDQKWILLESISTCKKDADSDHYRVIDTILIR